MKKIKIAFVCVHNSCRSQMAEGFGKTILSDLFDVYSAGTEKYHQIKPGAVAAMKERGIDISDQYPKLLSDIPSSLDILITMGCNVKCPHVPADIRDDWGIDDPSGGTEQDFRDARDKIEEKVMALYEKYVKIQGC